MSYCLVTGNTVQSEGGIPESARRLDTGQWVLGLRAAPVALQQACGYYEVVEVARPADTATDTFDRSVTLVAGVPTETWTQRAKTADELAAATANTNRATIETAITAALARLDTLIAAPAIGAVPAGTMTTSQLSTVCRELRDAAQANRAGSQDVAQILKQTIRLLRGDFTGTA